MKKYNGNKLNTKQKFETPNGDSKELECYIPSKGLIEAVELAMILKRPLLLMGEPGCGKTRLAEAVAYELHGNKMYDHFFRWDIKSTTKAKEGIYQYDALRRLYDANLNKAVDISIKNYIKYGKLGNAFITPQNGNLPNILLIDEIDKADIDFPNDLLLELENKEFYIPETGETKKAESQVIIFITSNREKELPAAFLRRCIFYYIDFPDSKQLEAIVSNHFEGADLPTTEIIAEFDKMRSQIAENDKKPSTSELLDWVKLIQHKKTEATDIAKIPFKAVLLKTYESYKLFNNDGE